MEEKTSVALCPALSEAGYVVVCSVTCAVIDPHLNDLRPHPIFPPSLCDLYFNRAFYYYFFTGLLRMAKDCIARRKCLSTASQTYLGWVVSLNRAVWHRGARRLADLPKDFSLCVFCGLFSGTECEFFQDCCLCIDRDSVLYSGKAELKLGLKTFYPVTRTITVLLFHFLITMT